jgi:GT2 family glycosyltransferase
MSRHETAPELEVNALNLGYAGGMNAGIRRVRDWQPDYVWLLNNDTLVDPQAISSLLAHSRSHPSDVMLGSTIADQASGVIQTAGGYTYYRWLGWNRPCLAGQPLQNRVDLRSSPKLDYIDGAALWLRGDFIQRVGGIPEKHFLYFEELELNQCLIKGESISWCPAAVVYHIQGGSAPTPELQARGSYHAAISAFRYTWRHQRYCLPTVLLARLIGVGFRALARRQPGLLLAVFTALGDFMVGREASYREQ